MADVKKYIPFLFKYEGFKYTNDPIDMGLATKGGVTLATWKRVGYDKNGDGKIDENDIKLLTKEDVVNKVLIPHFWNKWQADKIKNQSIANLLVDWLYMSGKYGIIFPQRILGVRDDGIVGKITLDAINNEPNKAELFSKLWNRRLKHFQDIVKKNPSQKRFLRGWVRRLQALHFEP